MKLVDIVHRLQAVAELASENDLPGPAVVRDVALAAAREIEDLRAQRPAQPPTPDRIDFMEKRVDSIGDDLCNLVAAMREVARKDSVHPSVRFLADTIALNLGGPARG